MKVLDRGRRVWDKVLTIIMVAAILAALGALGYVLTRSGTEEKYTEFYMLGLNGKADDYPSELKLGKDAKVILGIVNHEQRIMIYSIGVGIGDTIGNRTGQLELEDGEKWERVISFTPDRVGENQKLEFILYKNGESEPYLNLYLWVDVTE